MALHPIGVHAISSRYVLPRRKRRFLDWLIDLWPFVTGPVITSFEPPFGNPRHHPRRTLFGSARRQCRQGRKEPAYRVRDPACRPYRSTRRRRPGRGHGRLEGGSRCLSPPRSFTLSRRSRQWT